MSRNVDDQAYLNFLPTPLHRNRYLRWKGAMLQQLDVILADLERSNISDVMSNRGLTPKDVALLVRLHYVTDEEADKYGLREVEAMVP